MAPSEAAAYPATLKGSNWLAADMVIITASWNTSLVKKGGRAQAVRRLRRCQMEG